MRGKIIKYIYLFILCFFSNVSYANFENSIVVKVDDQIITNFEIKNKILSNLILSNKEINQVNINSLKRKAVDSLIQSKIKFIAISKYNLDASKSQINQYLNSISSNDIPSLKNKFDKNNLDFELFLEDIEIEFKWQKLIYQIYSKNISIDDKQIEFELRNLIKKNSNLKEYNISEIEIFIEENEQNNRNIIEIKDKITADGFEQTALNYSMSSSASNKGNIGWVNSKGLSKQIFDIIKDMKKNEISIPIRRQNSILFLKVNDVRNQKLNETNIANLKENIINQKKNELFNLYSKSHLSKVKNNSFIEFR
tara:strand:+ start:1558 stop:2487 length:930 start_codon:yes stop_codon:yes gene_type:complete